jgi:hypothetical protein
MRTVGVSRWAMVIAVAGAIMASGLSGCVAHAHGTRTVTYPYGYAYPYPVPYPYPVKVHRHPPGHPWHHGPKTRFVYRDFPGAAVIYKGRGWGPERCDRDRFSRRSRHRADG